jgi:peptidoglycan/LPS O-acetylase OafA/YrhL
MIDAEFNANPVLQVATMMSLKVLQQSNLQGNFVHSVLISLLRGCAALAVAAAHLRAAVYPGYSLISNPAPSFTALAFFTGFGHQAVVVFFLLSGWLVGGSLLNKGDREHAILHYAVDRLTRLWIVLVPTFTLILIVGVATGKVNGSVAHYAPANEFSGAAFIGNLMGLQNMVVPEFGGNFPLWSLANETWYYILFPILVLAIKAESALTRLFSLVAVAAIGVCLSGPILLYFTIWLMGAGCSRLKIEASRAMQLVLLAVFAAVALYFRVKGKNFDLDLESFAQDYIFSVAFLLFLSSTQYQLPPRIRLLQKVKQLGEFFAGFSFTLYVLHVPLIGMIVHWSGYLSANKLSANNPTHLAAYFVILSVIVVACYLFHLPFEANTHKLRNQIKRMIPSSAKSPVPG